MHSCCEFVLALAQKVGSVSQPFCSPFALTVFPSPLLECSSIVFFSSHYKVFEVVSIHLCKAKTNPCLVCRSQTPISVCISAIQYLVDSFKHACWAKILPTEARSLALYALRQVSTMQPKLPTNSPFSISWDYGYAISHTVFFL